MVSSESEKRNVQISVEKIAADWAVSVMFHDPVVVVERGKRYG
jgi:hypothetical protein